MDKPIETEIIAQFQELGSFRDSVEYVAKSQLLRMKSEAEVAELKLEVSDIMNVFQETESAICQKLMKDNPGIYSFEFHLGKQEIRTYFLAFLEDVLTLLKIRFLHHDTTADALIQQVYSAYEGAGNDVVVEIELQPHEGGAKLKTLKVIPPTPPLDNEESDQNVPSFAEA